MVVVHSVFEFTTFKMEKRLFFFGIRQNCGSIDILGLQSYDRQLVIRCFANWVCSGLQHLHRVYSGPRRTGDLCNQIDFGVLCRQLEDVHHEL